MKTNLRLAKIIVVILASLFLVADAMAEVRTYNSGDTPKAIPDPGETVSSITMPDSAIIEDVDVVINIMHRYDADLDVYLVAPDGTQVELFTDVGGGGDNFLNTIFDDEASLSISTYGFAKFAPFSGPYLPEGKLADFDGRNAQGIWQLKVKDDDIALTGTLQSWSLIIAGEAPPPPPPPPVEPTPPPVEPTPPPVEPNQPPVEPNQPPVEPTPPPVVPVPVTITVETGGDIAAANAIAMPGDTIQIAAGTYYLTSQIEIKSGVTYRGAGQGLTIIDGNNVTRAFVAWGDRGATNGQVDATGVGVPNTTGPKDWVLEGMTIQNCVADTVDRQDILSSARDLLTNYTGTPYTLAAAQTENGGIMDNPGWFDILSGGADDNLTDVELQAYLDANPVGSAGHLVVNEGKSGDGGAITIDNQAVGTIRNCDFLNNHTPAEGAGDDGGALNITGRSVITINDCLFNGNYSIDDGGAININTLSVVTLNGCQLDGNYACSPTSVAVEGLDGDGGHIKVQGGSASAITPGTTLIANHCIFKNGNASDDGGAIEVSATGNVVRLDSCWFEGNTSWDNGNVLRFGSTTQNGATITNCVFVNNITKADGGPDRMIEATRNSKFINCTFVGNNQFDEDIIYNNANAADTDGDGVNDETADTTQVVNCIFANNVVGTGDHVMGSRDTSFTIAATNCIFFGNTLQNGNAAANTQRPDLETGSVVADPLLDANYVPGAGSPAIDGGVDPATVGVTLTTDYNGAPRPQGAAYDIGAFESQPSPPPTPPPVEPTPPPVEPTPPPPVSIVIDLRIAATDDDSEEHVLEAGKIESPITSSDLELGYESGTSLQTVGCRWLGVNIPKGATITKAWVQFSADDIDNPYHVPAVSVVVEGELSANPATFTLTAYDISSRPTTTAKVVWDIPQWMTVHAGGPEEQTPDISSIIQEIVNQDGWAAGNAIVLLFRDNPANPSLGTREAESWDGAGTKVEQIPLLHIEFTAP